jgi:hypothetical protein
MKAPLRCYISNSYGASTATTPPIPRRRCAATFRFSLADAVGRSGEGGQGTGGTPGAFGERLGIEGRQQEPPIFSEPAPAAVCNRRRRAGPVLIAAPSILPQVGEGDLGRNIWLAWRQIGNAGIAGERRKLAFLRHVGNRPVGLLD